MRVTYSVLRLPATRCAVRCRGRMAVCLGVHTVGFGSGFRRHDVRLPGLVRGVCRRTITPDRRALTAIELVNAVSGSGMRAMRRVITVAGFARTRGGFHITVARLAIALGGFGSMVTRLAIALPGSCGTGTRLVIAVPRAPLLIV